MAQISFSIVVVCLNPGEKLLKTVQSVLNQKYGNYEIVVKDGGSTDGSLEQLPADSRIRVYTRPDSGIYDAMNQAMSYVTGQFVQFLNCGDLLHDDMVLERLAAVIERKRGRGADGEGLGHKEKERIFYGNQYHEAWGSVIYSAPEVNDFTCYRNVPCHQTCFYRKELFAERGYNPVYNVRADYEHFLWCYYKRRATALYAPIIVAAYEGGGYSETAENKRRSAAQHREITRFYMGRAKAGKYRMLMILSLAPLRTKMAESEKFSGFYNRMKSGIYKVTGKGR